MVEAIRPRGMPDVVPAALALGTALLLLGVPWPANLLLVGALAVTVVATVAPPAALGLLVASIPIQAVGEARLGSVHLTLTKVLLIALLVGWVYRVTTGRARWRGGWLAVAFAAHVLVVAASVANAQVVPHWSTELYRWWTGLVIYLVALDTVRDLRAARPVLVGTALGTLGSSLVGFYQVAEGIGPPSFSVGGFTRAYAAFGQPNPFAGYLEVTVPLLFALAVAWLAPPLRRQMAPAYPPGLVALCGAAALFGLAALALTQSRGGWIGAAVGLGAVVWLLGGGVRWSAVALGGVVAVVALATPLAGRGVDRLAAGTFGGTVGGPGEVHVTPENFAVQERLAHWRAGMAMARNYPLLGVGAGNFSDRYREHTQVWRFRVSRGHAHNAYIQAAAQTGLVGLGTYLAFVVAVGARLVRVLRRVSPAGRPLAVGAVGVSLAFATHGIFEYLHVAALPLQLSVVWALAEAGLAADRTRAAGAAAEVA